MSPRRTASSGEDSILAMLEREPARQRRPGKPGVRLWYGAGATLALALTGALVWMAANNDGLRPEGQELVLAEAENAPQQPAAAAGAAVVMDQAPAVDGVPPLRLLKPAPEKAASEKPVAEKSTPPLRAATAPAVSAAAPPARSLARTAPRTAAVAPAKPRPVMVARHAAMPVQPRAQRAVNPARTAQAPVDADVALISAVIVHANGHAPENSQMSELLCPNESCQARPPRQ